jgi:Protein of unknown function (DUF3987)
MANGHGADPSSFEIDPKLLHQEKEIERLRREVDALKKRNGKDGDPNYPDPRPLYEPEGEETPYPLDALPKIMRDAIEEYRPYGQQPLPMLGSSAIGATSLVCQGLADVARDARLVGPISLFIFVIAISGERKTASDNHFVRGVRKWMVDKRKELAEEDGRARALIAAWEAEREGLLLKIRRSAGEKAPAEQADAAAFQARLIELERSKPPGVVMPALFFEDVNAQTLAVEFATGWPSASLWSNEGGLVIGANGMNDANLMGFLALLNRLWDGQPFDRTRLISKSAALVGRRFTSSLMAQPVVFARRLTACEGASRGMGSIARTLLCWPRSTIGGRLYKDPPADMSANNQFNARTLELLDMKLPAEGPCMALAPPALPLSSKAKQEWIAFFNAIEKELGRTGEFGSVSDVGAKIAENAARVAGNFHVITHGPKGEISKETMEGAVKIAAWHLGEATRVITANEKPQEILDAEELFDWMLKSKKGPIDPRDILRFGPSRLRNKERRDSALKLLSEKEWLFEKGFPARLVINPKARG